MAVHGRTWRWQDAGGSGVGAHLGLLATLEDQMCRFGAEGFTGSPDRVDAPVWAVWALMREQTGGPRVRAL